MQLYEYFKPGLTQIVLATGKPTCPRLVPFNPLLPYPFSNPYFVFLWSRLSFSFSPSLCRTRFPRRRFFLVFSFIASVNSSLSLSLSSASLTLSPSFRVAYPSLSLSSSFSVTRLFPSVLCGAGTPTVDRFVSRKHERTSSANVIHRFLFQRERSTVERRQ